MSKGVTYHVSRSVGCMSMHVDAGVMMTGA